LESENAPDENGQHFPWGITPGVCEDVGHRSLCGLDWISVCTIVTTL